MWLSPPRFAGELDSCFAGRKREVRGGGEELVNQAETFGTSPLGLCSTYEGEKKEIPRKTTEEVRRCRRSRHPQEKIPIYSDICVRQNCI